MLVPSCMRIVLRRHNLAYFVYLKGGVESDKSEYLLYDFYFPAYKLQHFLTGERHNYDRPIPIDAE